MSITTEKTYNKTRFIEEAKSRGYASALHARNWATAHPPVGGFYTETDLIDCARSAAQCEYHSVRGARSYC